MGQARGTQVAAVNSLISLQDWENVARPGCVAYRRRCFAGEPILSLNSRHSEGKDLTTFVFAAETLGSKLRDDETAESVSDEVFISTKRSFAALDRLLTRKGQPLKSGDRVKVQELSLLQGQTAALIRMMVKLLDRGVTLEIVGSGIVIAPDDQGDARALLVALDAHRHRMSDLKARSGGASVTGRKRLIPQERLAEIQAQLNAPGTTTTTLARELGVARQTLFNYLDRYDPDWRLKRVKKSVRGSRGRVRDGADVGQGKPG